MKRINIVVTGSTGFIGTQLLEFLKKKKHVSVKVFDRAKHSLFKKDSLVPLMRGANVIYHLAGETRSDSKTIFDVNLQGTINLLSAIKMHNNKCKIIFTSTLSVYKIPRKNQIVSESFPISPHNNYGISKYLAEQAIRLFSNEEMLTSVILRISNPYGPSMKSFKHSAIATFIALAKQNKPIHVYGTGEQTRDFIFIDDVISGLWQAANIETKLPTLTLNLASGKETKLSYVMKLIEKCSGEKLRKNFRSAEKNSLGYWKIDPTKARHILKWSPSLSIEQGIKKTWENYP